MINEEPWYIKGTMLIVRYYHMFVEGELEKLLEKIEGITIEKSYFDHANWAVIIKKN
jgi:alkylated DNA repair protein alkB family protein 8